MSLTINSFSLMRLLQEDGQCDENEEQGTFLSVTLTKQIAFLALGTVSAFCIYKIKIRNNPNHLIQRFSTRGMELGRACYRAYQHQRTLYEIKRELETWEQLRDLYVQKPQDDSTEYGRTREMLSVIEPAATKVVTDVFTRYAARGSTLELGSNILNENGDSYFARLVSKKNLRDLSYSDYLPNVVKKESRKTQRSYRCLDATKLYETLPAASQTNVVALNVIDTISRDKLDSVVKGIHHVLRESGNMIILCDLPFDQTPLVDKFSTENNLVFPYLDGTNLGIKIIPRQALMRGAQSFGKPFVQFIESLMKLTQKKRGEVLFAAFGHRLQLCTILERVCSPEEVQRIDHKQSYIEDLTKAVTSHGGFGIVATGYFEDREIVQGGLSRPGINIVASDLRVPQFIYDGFDRNLPNNQVLIKSVFHAIVARKSIQSK